MSEEKKTTANDEAMPAGGQETLVEPQVASSDLFSFPEEKEANASPKPGALDDLPENVKKLLEKKKTEKNDGKKKKRKKKVEKKVSAGKVYIKATYNNTIVTITDLNGDVISWCSAGMAGFKGPKKSTPYASSIITRIAVERARDTGIINVGVYVKGVGTGREAAIRAINASGLTVDFIRDMTPIAHNGCRPRKPRRV
jgi:small subunit ribosomal protein S11